MREFQISTLWAGLVVVLGLEVLVSHPHPLFGVRGTLFWDSP